MMKLANLRAGRLAGTGVLVAIGLALAGCAGTPPDDADLESGKQLFVSSCGACHALEDAGTNTRIGPNLDDAFRGSRQQGFDESQFAGVVEAWIERPQPPMAKDIVVGVDKENVAAYVASVAGLSPDSEIRASEPFVIRPPVPGGDAPGADPPILLPGEKTAGPQPGSEPPPEEGEGG